MFSIATMPAQSAGSSEFETMEEWTASRPGPAQDLALDRLARSALAGTASGMASWREENFALYLTSLVLVTGLLAGLCVAAVSHRTAAPQARWPETRRKATLLATAIGAGSGVVLVTLMAFVPEHGRVTYFFAALGLGALAAAAGCFGGFVIGRKFARPPGERDGF